MLSVSCKASVKAVIYLGSKLGPEEKANINDVSKFIGESQHTVGKMLQRLAKADIINSLKGPNGGFYISDKQKKLPIMAIVEAIDGKEVFNQCGLGFNKCSNSHPCPFHHDFKEIRELFKEMCNKNSIEYLCAQVDEGLAFLIGK